MGARLDGPSTGALLMEVSCSGWQQQVSACGGVGLGRAMLCLLCWPAVRTTLIPTRPPWMLLLFLSIYPSGYVMAREKDCKTVDMCSCCWLPCSRPQSRCWPCTRRSGPCRPPSADCARCPRCRCRGCCRGEARSRTPALCSGEHNVMCYVRSKIQILFS